MDVLSHSAAPAMLQRLFYMRPVSVPRANPELREVVCDHRGGTGLLCLWTPPGAPDWWDSIEHNAMAAGRVMSMHSLREANRAKGDLLEDTVKNILDGNMGRYTGYRLILDAFKSFSVDAPDELKKKSS